MDEPASATLTLPRAEVGSRPRALWRAYVTEVREHADARAAVTAATDRRAALVLVVAALALTGANFLSDGSNPAWLESTLRAVGLDAVAARLHRALLESTQREFNQHAFWAIVVTVSYVVPALLLIRSLGERPRDYGVRAAGIGSHFRRYAVLYAIAAPFVVAVSYTSAFQDKYPFYEPLAGESLWPYLYAWWILYWLQFCALEFFFRGFLVHGLAPRLGYVAIFAMVLPYNMIHFGKPMAEALGAIVGGIVLGTLSLKTRSIWWGAALHIAIAFTMDVAALLHAGRIV